MDFDWTGSSVGGGRMAAERWTSNRCLASVCCTKVLKEVGDGIFNKFPRFSVFFFGKQVSGNLLRKAFRLSVDHTSVGVNWHG